MSIWESRTPVSPVGPGPWRIGRSGGPSPATGRRRYAEEIAHWRSQLRRLRDWYDVGSVDWWGLRPPAPGQRGPQTGQPVVDAVMALHRLRPTYLEELRLDAGAFAGQRVLEVGCGPLAPVLQSSACERHGLDPLADLYVRSGWPLHAYDVSFVNSRAGSATRRSPGRSARARCARSSSETGASCSTPSSAGST